MDPRPLIIQERLCIYDVRDVRMIVAFLPDAPPVTIATLPVNRLVAAVEGRSAVVRAFFWEGEEAIFQLISWLGATPLLPAEG